MVTFTCRTRIPKSHRVLVTVPPEVPEGPAELTVTVSPVNHLTKAERRTRVRKMLVRLAALRREFAHTGLNLSEEVIRQRHEED
jgi:hypothetical protein